MDSIWRNDSKLGEFQFEYEPWLTETDWRDLHALHAKYVECGHCVGRREIDSDPHLKSSVYYVRRFGGTSRLHTLASNGAIYRTIPVGVTEDSLQAFLIFRLQERVKTLKRPPLMNEVKNDLSMPHVELYRRYFNTWSNALRKAGFFKYAHCSISQGRKKRRAYWCRYSDQEILDSLCAKQSKITWDLRAVDVDLDVSLPSSSYLIKRFGKWSEIRKMIKEKIAE